MKTQIRKGPKGYEVWYSTDGGQTIQFHKTFKTKEEALRETVSLKNSIKFLKEFGVIK